MKFCDKCGNMLRVQSTDEGRVLYCKSCNTKKDSTGDMKIDMQVEVGGKGVIVIDTSEEDTFPVTEIMCPQCNEMRKAAWTMQQTRGGDEPPTRFYECKTCNYRWREYS